MDEALVTTWLGAEVTTWLGADSGRAVCDTESPPAVYWKRATMSERPTVSRAGAAEGSSAPCTAGRGAARGAGEPFHGRLAPWLLRASMTGWKYVTPPKAQSPVPPEVRPMAVLPEKSGPPLSPGSAHTLVRIIW